MSNRQPYSENALFGHGTGLRRKKRFSPAGALSHNDSPAGFSIPPRHTEDYNTRYFFTSCQQNKHQVSFCMKISQAKNHQTDEKGILKARSFFAQLRKIRPHEEHPGFSCGRKFCILLQTKNCLAESDSGLCGFYALGIPKAV